MIVSKRAATAACAAVTAGLFALSALAARAQNFTVTNLVSDGSVPAVTVDPSLINPWGIAFAPGDPFWVSNNGSGTSTLYDGAGDKIPLTVNIPLPPGKTGLAAPTGIVFNTAPHIFRVSNGAKSGSPIFIFDSEDGAISGWAPDVDPSNAILAVDNSSEAAVYKGLANATVGVNNYLYAANFRAADVEMFNGKYELVKTFTDPNVPKGYAPFNVQNIGGTLYVTFARQDAVKHDDVAGPGHGFVDAFSLDGALLRRIASHGPLNSPWGLDIAPASFGAFAGDLLVGNFGDGWINAFDPITGAYKGALTDTTGSPIVIGDLWALATGAGGASGDPGTVYFTAGVQNEAHGLFGAISVASGPMAPKTGAR